MPYNPTIKSDYIILEIGRDTENEKILVIKNEPGVFARLNSMPWRYSTEAWLKEGGFTVLDAWPIAFVKEKEPGDMVATSGPYNCETVRYDDGSVGATIFVSTPADTDDVKIGPCFDFPAEDIPKILEVLAKVLQMIPRSDE